MAVGVNIVSEFNAKGIKQAIAEFKKLETAGAKATYGIRTLDSALGNGIRNIAKFGTIAAAGFAAVGYKLAQTAEDAQVADRAMLQVATSMGLFGGQTQQVVDRLTELASTQQAQLGIDEDTIKATQTKLLTFKNLAATADEVGGAFDRATMAALDLAAAGFGEATQNATQLGKALQDPIKGINALARSGVTFTAQEKEKIATLAKSGQMLAAQEILLQAIETQVGGTAEASAKATDKIRLAFGEVAESLGSMLLPYFERFAEFLNNKVVPYFKKLADIAGESGMGAVFKTLATDLLKVTTNMGTLGNVVLGITAALVALRLVTIAATIAQVAFGVSLLTSPIGIAVAAIIALGVALAALYLKFEGVRKVVNSVINFVIRMIENLINSVINFVNLFRDAINLMIKVANKFGAGLEELGDVGEVSLGRITTGAKNAGKALATTMESLRAIRNAERAGTEAKFVPTYTGGSGATKAVETAKEKIQKYIDALKGQTAAEKAVRDAMDSTSKARSSLAAATKKVADAQAKFNLVTKGYPADSKQALDAMRKVEDAQKRLRNANIAQEDAVRGVAAAEKKLAELRAKKADPTSVAEAERNIEKAKYSVEEANFRVADAEKELADTRLDPEASASDIRRAEIALAEAKLEVFDAVNAVTDAETKLANERSAAATPEEIADAERDLMRAKMAVSDAIDDQRDATNELTAAQMFQTMILQGAAEGTDEYKEALDELLAAQDNEKDAHDRVREAIEKEIEATDKLREAKEKLRDVGGEVGGGAVSAAISQVARNNQNAIVSVATGGTMTTVPDFIDNPGQAARNIQIVNNITAGMGADAQEIQRVIIDNLRDYERANGYIPITSRYTVA